MSPLNVYPFISLHFYFDSYFLWLLNQQEKVTYFFLPILEGNPCLRFHTFIILCSPSSFSFSFSAFKYIKISFYKFILFSIFSLYLPFNYQISYMCGPQPQVSLSFHLIFFLTLWNGFFILNTQAKMMIPYLITTVSLFQNHHHHHCHHYHHHWHHGHLYPQAAWHHFQQWLLIPSKKFPPQWYLEKFVVLLLSHIKVVLFLLHLHSSPWISKLLSKHMF